MIELPDPLLELVRSARKHLWIGTYPPFDFDGLALYGCTNFRAAAELHQQFEVVWCYEDPLTRLGAESYALFLDELVRFIGEKGILVLRYDTELGVLAVKNNLGRRIGLTVRTRSESVDKAGMITSVFEIERRHIAHYQPGAWSFGILTQNTRKANVVAFLKSIRNHDPAGQHEVIICGPEDAEYAFANPRYLPMHYSIERAEISRKKNDIARAATRPNLLIAHDRYRLDDNFFTGFEQYGYDFDFVTIPQYFEDGGIFPAYCYMVHPGLRMTPPKRLTSLNELPGQPFINGGLMVVKTHILQAVPMNELIYWNQAEDVELTVAMMQRGLAPRLNPYSSATTLGIGPTHIKAYLPDEPVAAPPEPSPPATEPAPVAPPPTPRPSLAYRAARKGKHTAKRYQKYLFAFLLGSIALMQVAALYLLAGR